MKLKPQNEDQLYSHSSCASHFHWNLNAFSWWCRKRKSSLTRLVTPKRIKVNSSCAVFFNRKNKSHPFKMLSSAPIGRNSHKEQFVFFYRYPSRGSQLCFCSTTYWLKTIQFVCVCISDKGNKCYFVPKTIFSFNFLKG